MEAPWWLVAIVVVWIAGIGAVHAAREASGDAIVTCTFRRVTGVPCGTCGSTRAAGALLRGDAAAALAYNPFVAVGGAALVLVGALRLGCGRRVELGLGHRGRRLAWCVVGAAFAANWAYVIAYHSGAAADPGAVRTGAGPGPSTPPPPP